MAANPVHQARADMINGMFPLPDETLAAMKEIREIYADAAYRLLEVTAKVRHDPGRITHALDMFQAGKDVSCGALILPHWVAQKPATAPEDVKE